MSEAAAEKSSSKSPRDHTQEKTNLFLKQIKALQNKLTRVKVVKKLSINRKSCHVVSVKTVIVSPVLYCQRVPLRC